MENRKAWETSVKVALMIIIGIALGMFFGQCAKAAPVIIFSDTPIVRDTSITVETFYDDKVYTGVHTIIYSTRHPQVLFYHQVAAQVVDTFHSHAVTWIINKIMQEIEQRLRNATVAAQPRSVLQLYDIDEEEEEDTKIAIGIGTTK